MTMRLIISLNARRLYLTDDSVKGKPRGPAALQRRVIDASPGSCGLRTTRCELGSSNAAAKIWTLRWMMQRREATRQMGRSA